MTTHTDLLEIITNGENSGVEFKRDVLQNYDLAKELVAFSNLRGGIVQVGGDLLARQLGGPVRVQYLDHHQSYAH